MTLDVSHVLGDVFGVPLGDSSPFWHAIARENLERWAHHSQIRRALGLGSLADSPFLDVGADILTLAHSSGEVAALVEGPGDLVDQFAARVGRR